jgi:hypothetical protein
VRFYACIEPFEGPSVFVNYGNVQVKITVANGKITEVVAGRARRCRLVSANFLLILSATNFLR